MSDCHLFRYECLVFCGFHADVLPKNMLSWTCVAVPVLFCSIVGTCNSASALIVLVIKQWWRSTRCKRICPNCPKWLADVKKRAIICT